MADIVEKILFPVKEEMEKYNQTFDSYMTTDNPLLDNILKDMSKHKGKGMRPLITILSAKMFGEVQDVTYHLAAA